MNLEELQAMSDAELNELSAVKVMGWANSFYFEGKRYNGEFSKESYPKEWNPTTDMNDAMELVDALRKKGIIMNMYTWENHYNVTIDGEKGASHESLPRAISIASILAKESES